jgi:hypothetical protein
MPAARPVGKFPHRGAGSIRKRGFSVYCVKRAGGPVQGLSGAVSVRHGRDAGSEVFMRNGSNRRAAGLFAVSLCALCLLSCSNLASNGIFDINTGNAADWVSAVKFSVRTDYPMPPAQPGEARQYPDFSASRDVIAWAIYYDGSGRMIDSRELLVTIAGFPVTSDPFTLNFLGVMAVNIRYGRWSLDYKITVGSSGSGSGEDTGDDGTSIDIVIH